MKYILDLITDLNADLLEGPVYDVQSEALYFVSILDFRVYRYLPSSSTIDFIQLNSPTSCIFLSQNYGVVAASTSGFYRLDFGSRTAEKVFKIQIDKHLRFNDGVLDAHGRFLIGTMGYPEIIDKAGALLSYDGSDVKILIRNVTISNGIAFSRDSKTMFFIDTPTKRVARYSYFLDTGECSFKDYFIHFSDLGVPDGMDIDSSGNLWIAEWGGYKVSVWDSESGKMKGTIDLPHAFVTSVCVADDKTLYITTAKSIEAGKKVGGALFKAILTSKDI